MFLLLPHLQTHLSDQANGHSSTFASYIICIGSCSSLHLNDLHVSSPSHVAWLETRTMNVLDAHPPSQRVHIHCLKTVIGYLSAVVDIASTASTMLQKKDMQQ